MDANNGHYVTFILNNGKWLLFDDASITEACEEDMLKQQSYILFYQRNDKFKQVSILLGQSELNWITG